MADISQHQTKIKLQDFKKMIKNVEKFKDEKGRDPKIVYVAPKYNDWISYDRFKDMYKRYQEFKLKNNREPAFIWITYPTAELDSDCVHTGYFSQDFQDTGYSCGASSLRMALSAYKINVSEQELMRIAGTTTAGTTHDGMIRALRHYHLYGIFRTLSEVGFQGMKEWIKDNGEIILHVMTNKLRTDCNGNTVWRGSYGHYVYVYSVCTNSKKIFIADPTKGLRCHTFEQMTEAINAVTWAPSILLITRDERMLQKYARAGGPIFHEDLAVQMQSADYIKEYAKIKNIKERFIQILLQLYYAGLVDKRLTIDELIQSVPHIPSRIVRSIIERLYEDGDIVTIDGRLVLDTGRVISVLEEAKKRQE